MTGWHLDKRIPLALILALVGQTIGIVWWAATLNSRVETLEKWVDSRPRDIPQNIGSRVAVLETRFDNIMRLLGRIEIKLDRLPQKP